MYYTGTDPTTLKKIFYSIFRNKFNSIMATTNKLIKLNPVFIYNRLFAIINLFHILVVWPS